MIINATLLVQIVHFGITYFILSRIILYPAATMLLREDEVYTRIVQDIEHLKQQAHDYETFRKQQWNRCIHALSSRKPRGPYVPKHRTGNNIVLDDISVDIDTRDAVHALRDAIVQRVSND